MNNHVCGYPIFDGSKVKTIFVFVAETANACNKKLIF